MPGPPMRTDERIQTAKEARAAGAPTAVACYDGRCQEAVPVPQQAAAGTVSVITVTGTGQGGPLAFGQIVFISTRRPG